MAEEISMPSLGATEDTPMPGRADPAVTLLVGLIVGLGYYWVSSQGNEEDEEPVDSDDEVADEEVERPKAHRMSRLADATTDSLIDRPAVIASSGKPSDCKKAVKLLPASAAIAKSEGEVKLFRRVLKAVADDCHGAEEAVDDALEEIEAIREEIEEELGVDVSAVERNPEKAIAARRAAQQAIVEGGLRKTKRKKLPVDENAWLTRVSSTKGSTKRGGRPRGASLTVRKPSGMSYRLRQEKASTKRGYKWRKEEV